MLCRLLTVVDGEYLAHSIQLYSWYLRFIIRVLVEFVSYYDRYCPSHVFVASSLAQPADADVVHLNSVAIFALSVGIGAYALQLYVEGSEDDCKAVAAELNDVSYGTKSVNKIGCVSSKC